MTNSIEEYPQSPDPIPFVEEQTEES